MRFPILLAFALAAVGCTRPSGEAGPGNSAAADSVGGSRWVAPLTHAVVSLAPLADGGLAVLDGSGKLTAFDGDGHPAPGPEVAGARALVRSGDRLIVATAGGLIARPLTASSTAANWTWAARSGVMGRPLVASDGGIVVSDGAELVRLDPATGAESWRTALGDSLRAAPVEADGALYAAAVGGAVTALDLATGQKRWTTELNEPVFVSPIAVGRDVFVGSTDHLTALSLTATYNTSAERGPIQAQSDASGRLSGAALWRVAIRAPVHPLVARSGLVYAVDGMGTLAAYRDAGRAAWRVALGTASGPPTAPIRVGDRLYVGNQAGQLVALSAVSGAVVWSRTLSSPVTVRPVVSPDSTRLFVAAGAAVHAVRLR